MKHSILFFVVICLIFCFISFMCGISYHDYHNCKSIKAYHDYYNAAEALLDTLENDCNWVDRFDPYDYYDAKEALNK